MGRNAPSEKVIWVTGASSGIGAALATHAANEGARVAISARGHDKLEGVARLNPDRIHAFPLDVTDGAATGDIVSAIENELGPIDIAVMNAGAYWETPAETFRAADMAALCGVNLISVAHGVEALLPRMMARGRGRLALVASAAGYRGLPRASAYCATKAGLIAMAESLKPELDPKGVSVQVVCPGFVRTPLTDENEFPMPFLMEPDIAARRIWEGLQTDRFEIAFPRRFIWQLKLLSLLPATLYFAAIKKVTGIGRE